jgi:hypothetical protein
MLPKEYTPVFQALHPLHIHKLVRLRKLGELANGVSSSKTNEDKMPPMSNPVQPKQLRKFGDNAISMSS